MSFKITDNCSVTEQREHKNQGSFQHLLACCYLSTTGFFKKAFTQTTTLENYVPSDYCFVRYSLIEIKPKHNQYLMEKTGRGQLIRLSTEKSIQTKKIQKGVFHSRQKKTLSQMQH